MSFSLQIIKNFCKLSIFMYFCFKITECVFVCKVLNDEVTNLFLTKKKPSEAHSEKQIMRSNFPTFLLIIIIKKNIF